MKWTPEEINRVFTLRDEGKTFTEIGAELGKKRLACLGVYHRERVRRGHVPNSGRVSISGISPELLRNTTPKRAYTRKIAPPAVPTSGVGFMLATIAPPPIQKQGRLVGILDVTGCKWALAEDASLAGGFAFCDAPKVAGRPYCECHAKMARSTIPVSTWLKRAAA